MQKQEVPSGENGDLTREGEVIIIKATSVWKVFFYTRAL